MYLVIVPLGIMAVLFIMLVIAEDDEYSASLRTGMLYHDSDVLISGHGICKLYQRACYNENHDVIGWKFVIEAYPVDLISRGKKRSFRVVLHETPCCSSEQALMEWFPFMSSKMDEFCLSADHPLRMDFGNTN